MNIWYWYLKTLFSFGVTADEPMHDFFNRSLFFVSEKGVNIIHIARFCYYFFAFIFT